MTEAERAAEMMRLERLIQSLPTGFEWSAIPKMQLVQRGRWVSFGKL